jgi:hypothetical protein
MLLMHAQLQLADGFNCRYFHASNGLYWKVTEGFNCSKEEEVIPGNQL